MKPTPVATPVENMITQKDIPSTAELFTANLGSWRDADDPDEGQSFYTFGKNIKNHLLRIFNHDQTQ